MLSSSNVCNLWAELGEQNFGVLFSILNSIYLVALLFDYGFVIHLVARLAIIYE